MFKKEKIVLGLLFVALVTIGFTSLAITKDANAATTNLSAKTGVTCDATLFANSSYGPSVSRNPDDPSTAVSCATINRNFVGKIDYKTSSGKCYHSDWNGVREITCGSNTPLLPNGEIPSPFNASFNWAAANASCYYTQGDIAQGGAIYGGSFGIICGVGGSDARSNSHVVTILDVVGDFSGSSGSSSNTTTTTGSSSGTSGSTVTTGTTATTGLSSSQISALINSLMATIAQLQAQLAAKTGSANTGSQTAVNNTSGSTSGSGSGSSSSNNYATTNTYTTTNTYYGMNGNTGVVPLVGPTPDPTDLEKLGKLVGPAIDTGPTTECDRTLFMKSSYGPNYPRSSSDPSAEFSCTHIGKNVVTQFAYQGADNKCYFADLKGTYEITCVAGLPKLNATNNLPYSAIPSVTDGSVNWLAAGAKCYYTQGDTSNNGAIYGGSWPSICGAGLNGSSIPTYTWTSSTKPTTPGFSSGAIYASDLEKLGKLVGPAIDTGQTTSCDRALFAKSSFGSSVSRNPDDPSAEFSCTHIGKNVVTQLAYQGSDNKCYFADLKGTYEITCLAGLPKLNATKSLPYSAIPSITDATFNWAAANAKCYYTQGDTSNNGAIYGGSWPSICGAGLHGSYLPPSPSSFCTTYPNNATCTTVSSGSSTSSSGSSGSSAVSVTSYSSSSSSSSSSSKVCQTNAECTDYVGNTWDTCSAGVCFHTTKSCYSKGDCDDGNAASTDICFGATSSIAGTCSNY